MWIVNDFGLFKLFVAQSQASRLKPPRARPPRRSAPGTARDHGVCVALSVELCVCVCVAWCVGGSLCAGVRCVAAWGGARLAVCCVLAAGRKWKCQVGSGGGHRCARGDEATLLRRPPPPPRAIHRTRPPKSHQPHSSQVEVGAT